MKKNRLTELLKRLTLSGVILAAGVAGIAKRDGVHAKVARNVPVLKKFFFKEIDGATFSEAFREARQRGLKTFIWAQNGKAYTTEYKGSNKEQMEKYGIVNDQLQDRRWWQDRLADNLNPGGYEGAFHRVWSAVVLGQKMALRETAEEQRLSRMDYFNTYMGRPQQHDTLGISDYAPANVGEVNGKKMPAEGRVIYKDNELSRYLAKYWAIYVQHLLSESNHKESRIVHQDMYRFKMSLGHDKQGDYICYHDTWNMAPFGPTTDFGKPFEVYDRIYFDREKLNEAFREQKQIAMDSDDDALSPWWAVCGVLKLESVRNGGKIYWIKRL